MILFKIKQGKIIRFWTQDYRLLARAPEEKKRVIDGMSQPLSLRLWVPPSICDPISTGSRIFFVEGSTLSIPPALRIVSPPIVE